jgi:hypothetical protein
MFTDLLLDAHQSVEETLIKFRTKRRLERAMPPMRCAASRSLPTSAPV